ncbi:MAG: hypothetical protein AABX16_05525 [Nanoarchaeota archaeon]
MELIQKKRFKSSASHFNSMNLARMVRFETIFLIVLAVASIFNFYFFPASETSFFMFNENISTILREGNGMIMASQENFNGILDENGIAEISEKNKLLIEDVAVIDMHQIETFFDEHIFNTSHAPSNYLSEEQIEVYDDRIVIYINGSSLSHYADSGSMKPLLDAKSNGIRIKPDSVDDISVGDIISFRHNDLLIVHRVIQKGKDEEGVYFITKGDNNILSDGKARFDQIEYKTIGVLW